jgi:hypothetical protein
VYGSGFPKSLNIGKAVDKLQGNEREVIGREDVGHDITGGGYKDAKSERKIMDITKGASEREGYGTALKPALEPITVARKPLSEKTVAENVLKWGTGGINIDGCRVGTEEVETGRGNRKAPQFSGTYNNGEIYEGKKESGTIQGRFPANFIHDGSQMVLDLFPESVSSDAVRKNKVKIGLNGIYNKYDPQDTFGFNDSGSAARFFYCAKASKSERNAGCGGLEEKQRIDYGGFHSEKGLIKNNRNPENRLPMKNNHPTVKPIKLMSYLVRLVTPEGGIVLDPFAGSGTTALSAIEEGADFIVMEREKDYVDIIKSRVSKWSEL